MSGALRLSRDIDADERQERVDELLNDLGLSAVADNLVSIVQIFVLRDSDVVVLIHPIFKGINLFPKYRKDQNIVTVIASQYSSNLPVGYAIVYIQYTVYTVYHYHYMHVYVSGVS